MRRAAELFKKRGAAYRLGRGAAAGRHGAAHLAGQRAGRGGDGPVSAGAGGVLAVRHAGHGGRLGGGYPADGRGAQPDTAAAPAGCCCVCWRRGFCWARCVGAAVRPQLALAAAWWLGDVRAAGALRASALGLPWMAVSAVLRGFFMARRQVGPNVFSQLAEQTVRIAIWLRWGGAVRWTWAACTVVLAATALSEMRFGLPDASVLPAGGPERFRAGRPTRRPGPPPVGDPVAGGGRAGPGQRPAHGREHAGARLPCGLSGRSRAGAARHWSSTEC